MKEFGEHSFGREERHSQIRQGSETGLMLRRRGLNERDGA
jgi:hypothetical protein